MIAPDGKYIRLFVRGYVPYVRKDSFTGEYREVDPHEAKTAPASEAFKRITGRRAPTVAEAERPVPDLSVGIGSNDPQIMALNDGVHGLAEGDGAHEGSDADAEGAPIKKSRKRVDLEREARTIRHKIRIFQRTLTAKSVSSGIAAGRPSGEGDSRDQ